MIAAEACPPGSTPNLEVEAEAECGGSASVDVTTQSGSGSVNCSGGGSCKFRCDSTCGKGKDWKSVTNADGSASFECVTPETDECDCTGKCGQTVCGNQCGCATGLFCDAASGECVDECKADELCGLERPDSRH